MWKGHPGGRGRVWYIGAEGAGEGIYKGWTEDGVGLMWDFI